MTPQNFWQQGNLYIGKELVMGLPNSVVFAHGQWQGFLMDTDKCQEIKQLIETKAEWRPRKEAETDNNWQQIYPYALFKYDNLYSEFKRGTQNTSDSRLNLKYTMAVGGHVFKPEYDQAGNLDNWIQQLFHHDIDYQGNLTPHCCGILNDNSDDLGRYHIGIVYLLEGDSNQLHSNIHAETRLLKLQDFTNEDIGFLERWSQMVYRQLRDKELQEQTGGPQHFHVKHLMENYLSLRCVCL